MNNTTIPPSVYKIAQDIVKIRCKNDFIKENNCKRHCCAIFVEKNRSCFKTSIDWSKPRQLQTKKKK